MQIQSLQLLTKYISARCKSLIDRNVNCPGSHVINRNFHRLQCCLRGRNVNSHESDDQMMCVTLFHCPHSIFSIRNSSWVRMNERKIYLHVFLFIIEYICYLAFRIFFSFFFLGTNQATSQVHLMLILGSRLVTVFFAYKNICWT